MEKRTCTVPNMSCGHCKMRIEKALNGLDGVASATANVETKVVAVEWDASTVSWGDIQGSLEKIGYPAEV
ncbi:hypothetical protein CSA56_07000 [candidate division KSB3 bacterium]|uniref:HMA domain-containing protein n=1 Tax=candidate division KSB3 bacterium TaxID=2044937 RepID=A0A2G6KGB8_9BACT|nr:MAG: hypothetical protein CSA56_07000 [candidate division KSB3 bacterium]